MPSCLTEFAAAFWSFQTKVMPLSGKYTSIEISIGQRIDKVNTLLATHFIAEPVAANNSHTQNSTVILSLKGSFADNSTLCDLSVAITRLRKVNRKGFNEL